MDPSTRVVGLDAQGNMVFTVVKPVMGIFQVSSEQAGSVGQGGMGLQGLSENTLVLPQVQDQTPLDQNQVEMHTIQPHIQPQMHVSAPVQTEDVPQNQEPPPNSSTNSGSGTQMPFAEVSSLLDPNMKGSKARKYLISYDEIKRRLQAPEKMSLRSLAAYTRVSRGPASKKTLLESLNVLGLTPSTTTSVSSSFSKLTEGDTGALCDDMKDFAHDYIDYCNMAKQLIPETNTVQHWSKIIETKNHLEDMRKCFKDPVNSGAFDNVTHGLGLGMLDVALDMIIMVIEQQIRILSGAAASDPADSGPPMRRTRRRHRKTRSADIEKPYRVAGGVKEQGKIISKGKGRGKAKKKIRQETGDVGPVETQAEQCKPDDVESNVLTLVSVGYETVSSGLTADGTV
ncbi:uncharacterized protein si:ch73-127m5.2 [Xiphias gladius]|uniref:uncharacterized protein si:ch73-127m5.2 n=1 Tax=Xiphias gladius TaxID=8245 RepID=UPI001A9954EC|nr:uncharacterized protein si:ch73-127m5.2 [Xiphias gladius]XP_039992051.1 uncharacterized protein si:ch73-127m5.2 [Xiphias gladius]XP_039992052.1 uncharacterized protein si:ch73-127m5.2 [Xiphias gladius]XP_039992053.1 uncharacterized protein si:ch73-127m5.2 [Xiphias gladius]